MVKFLNADNHSKKGRKRKNKKVTLSKTKEMGQTIEADHHISTEEEGRNFIQNNLRGFSKIDARYLIPFFTRQFTQQEVRDCKSQMTDLTNNMNKWYSTINLKRPQSSEEYEEEEEHNEFA